MDQDMVTRVLEGTKDIDIETAKDDLAVIEDILTRTQNENECLRAKIIYLEGQLTGMKEATRSRFIADTGKELKKSQKIPNRIRKQAKLKKPKASALDSSMATRMEEAVRNVIGESRKPTNISAWAEDIRRMRERDNLKPSAISETFLWANRDEFWKSVVLSPTSLRRNWDKIRAKMGIKVAGEITELAKDNIAYIKDRMQ